MGPSMPLTAIHALDGPSASTRSRRITVSKALLPVVGARLVGGPVICGATVRHFVSVMCVARRRARVARRSKPPRTPDACNFPMDTARPARWSPRLTGCVLLRVARGRRCISSACPHSGRALVGVYEMAVDEPSTGCLPQPALDITRQDSVPRWGRELVSRSVAHGPCLPGLCRSWESRVARAGRRGYPAATGAEWSSRTSCGVRSSPARSARTAIS